MENDKPVESSPVIKRAKSNTLKQYPRKQPQAQRLQSYSEQSQWTNWEWSIALAWWTIRSRSTPIDCRPTVHKNNWTRRDTQELREITSWCNHIEYAINWECPFSAPEWWTTRSKSTLIYCGPTIHKQSTIAICNSPFDVFLEFIHSFKMLNERF